MRLTHLSLYRFRTFPELDLDLPGGLLLFHGHNGAGKSNLLEACYLLAITKSYRAGNERELLSFAARTPEEVPFVRVAGTAQNVAGKQTRVQVDLLWRDTPGATDASGALSKRIRVNGLPSRASEALGAVSAVLFTADDLQIVTGPPAARRRFLDILLCQLEPAYLRSLQRYQQVLLQRNHLLRMVRDGRSQTAELEFWDAELSRHGATITERRAALLRELAAIASALYAEVASGQEALGVTYQPSLTGTEGDASALADAMLKGLAEGRRREVAAGQTLLGPHRDDLALTVGGAVLATYASRGQARGVALALRLAEARVIARVRGEEPVLLLDDLLSELDPARRRQVLAAAARADQAILTTADPAQFADAQLASAPRFLVTPGGIARER
jgi:DNA replication and repair protein RecF